MNSYEQNGIGDFVRDLRHSYDQLPETDDWLTESLRGSMSSLLDHATDEWLVERKGLRVHFEHGAIKGHTGPASAILKGLTALNDAVVHLVNSSLEKPYKDITDPIRERFGMLLIPASAGSVVVELVCQPSGDIDQRPHRQGKVIEGQSVHPIVDEVQSPAETAVDRILDVVSKAVNIPIEHQRELEEALLALPRNSVSAINRFVSQCDELQATVEVSDRTPQTPPVTVLPTDARHLKHVIKYLGLDEQEADFDGEWLTYSDVRTNFDLRLKDGTLISGRVPKNLLDDSYAALKKYVRVTLDARQKGGEDGPTRYTLKSISVLANAIPEDFYEKDEATDDETSPESDR
ncbi:hypothetical protein ACFFIO_08000 [Citricoccus parietis]|uniref:Uncharacterized protein n=1 Tax=Citricoccus parietis TaxID=592307 RepID=A0ABV6F4J9_9MICC